MTDRVMIDLETLGTDPGCAIVSVGAVRFGRDEIGERKYLNISLSSCADADLGIDISTLEWWLKQPDEVQKQLHGGEDLETALGELWKFMLGANEVWANSPSFDCAILAEAFDAAELGTPWEFWEERDFRTLSALPQAPDLSRTGTKHDALDDARHQAEVAAETLARLEEADE